MSHQISSSIILVKDSCLILRNIQFIKHGADVKGSFTRIQCSNKFGFGGTCGHGWLYPRPPSDGSSSKKEGNTTNRSTMPNIRCPIRVYVAIYVSAWGGNGAMWENWISVQRGWERESWKTTIGMLMPVSDATIWRPFQIPKNLLYGIIVNGGWLGRELTQLDAAKCYVWSTGN